MRLVAVVAIVYGAFALNLDGHTANATPAWLASRILEAEETPAGAMLFILIGVVLLLLSHSGRDRDAA